MMLTRGLSVGTRRSQLALAQVTSFQKAWSRVFPEESLRVVPLSVYGDEASYQEQGLKAQGMFTRFLERALIDGAVDLVVHSLKDLPTAENPLLALPCILERGDCRDAFLSHHATTLHGLPAGSVVGTSSPRRKAQLLSLRPDLQVKPLRGNIVTRLRKLEVGQYDGIVLSVVGLRRIGMTQSIQEILEADVMLPCAGQGAIAVQCRASDGALRTKLQMLNHKNTEVVTHLERHFLRLIDATCFTPVAAYASLVQQRITAQFMVLSEDGKQKFVSFQEGSVEKAQALAFKAFQDLQPHLTGLWPK